VLIGHSVEHRPITVTRVGDPAAHVRVIVVGDVHGNERAGERIVALLARRHPTRARLWLVRSANPDGAAAGTRSNARGVDLNRNFPHRWRPGPRGTYHPGPRAASEPETRAVMRLVRRVRPQLAVYYHQHLRMVVRAGGADPAVQRTYARVSGLPLRSLPAYRGTAVGWENRILPRGSAFVVELPAANVGARRHAATVLTIARRLASGGL
jgi:protein MpaA